LLLLAVGSFLAALVIAELAWRVALYRAGQGFFDDPRDFVSPFFTTYDQPRPFLEGEDFEFTGGTVKRVKPADEIRVLCLGGSTTLNFRAGISYTDVLEARFAAAADDGWHVRFLNAGSEGFSTAQMLVNLSLRNIDVQPDIVTIYENVNDLAANFFGAEVQSDYANKYLTDFYLGFRHRTGFVAELTKVSRLARFFAERIMALAYPEQTLFENRDYHRGLEYFARNLRSIIAVARAHDIRIALVSQAARGDQRRAPGFAAYNETIRRVAADQHVPFIDVAGGVTEDRYFFDDAIHNTREGVEAVADRLFEPLAGIIEEVKTERSRGGATTAGQR
jgi:lysophospholipase L1-like esterase